MATHQHATVGDTVYMWFGANTTGGDGNDGASPVWSARLGGAAAGAAATDTGVPTLLTHANYTAGAHEIAVVASVGNGFAAGNTYGVFCSLLVSSVNPTGVAGSFTLAPIISDMTHIHGSALTETAGQLAAAFVKFFNVAAPTATALSLPDAVPGAAGGGFIAGTNAATSITTALTANITGSLSGSVGTVAANGITATSLATDAINAASVKADAVTKIQNGLAPSGEYDTQLDANISTRATSAKQDTMETTLDTVNTKIGTPIDIDSKGASLSANLSTIVDDDGGTTYDAETDSLAEIRTRGDAAWTPATGFATETKQDAGDVVTARIAAIQEADKVFVPASGTLTYNTKGTSSGLLKKNLKDPAGAAVNSTEDIIASEVNTTP